MDEEELLEEQKQLEAGLIPASEFAQEQYLNGNYGGIPEMPEDFELIRGGYRSRELR